MIYYYREEAPPQLVKAMDWSKEMLFKHFEGLKIEEGETFPECWIAGGALSSFFTNRVPRDIDIFTTSNKSADSLNHYMKYNFTERYNHENSIGLINRENFYNYEIVKTIYAEDPELTLEQFDFTVSCAAVTPDFIVFHDTYFVDLLSKNLVPVYTRDITTLFPRMQKFMNKGYKMEKEHMQTIMETIALAKESELEVSDKEEVVDKTTGRDIKINSYGKLIMGNVVEK